PSRRPPSATTRPPRTTPPPTTAPPASRRPWSASSGTRSSCWTSPPAAPWPRSTRSPRTCCPRPPAASPTPHRPRPPPETRPASSALKLDRVTDALDPQDAKIITLARGQRARSGAVQGAAVRDDIGRTYAASTVTLPSLRLSALQLAVALAVSGGA